MTESMTESLTKILYGPLLLYLPDGGPPGGDKFFLALREVSRKKGQRMENLQWTNFHVYRLKSKEPLQTFVPKILASSYPKWAKCKGFLEPKSVNLTKS